MGSHNTVKDNIIYHSIEVLNSDGELIFLCDEDKSNYYTGNNLASVVSESPKIIKLYFSTNGNGHRDDPFFLQKRKNRCVVCGSGKNLTRHHIVPYTYRKHFPESTKRIASHDIVAMCSCCHYEYETKAVFLTKKIMKEYNVSNNIVFPFYQNSPERISAIESIITLYKYKDSIPDDRIAILEQRIISVYGKRVLDKDKISELAKKILLIRRKNKSSSRRGKVGKNVVSKISCLQLFTEIWRRHFIENAKPQFMPELWDLNRSIFRYEKKTEASL